MRASSHLHAKLFLNSLINTRPSAFNMLEFEARVTYIFENDFLYEDVTVLISTAESFTAVTIPRSIIAKTHNQEPIYNTLFHTFELKTDGELMIFSRENADKPFVIWITAIKDNQHTN